MNASVVQNANLAPMSVEEMEMVDGGNPLAVLVVLGTIYIGYLLVESSAKDATSKGLSDGFNAGYNAAKP